MLGRISRSIAQALGVVKVLCMYIDDDGCGWLVPIFMRVSRHVGLRVYGCVGACGWYYRVGSDAVQKVEDTLHSVRFLRRHIKANGHTH